jgi:POT family proton-dependent oligopeptide transporter
MKQLTASGHPRGLPTLFFTEMGERFSYYGMRAMLVLFMVAHIEQGGLGLDDRTATAIYGLYTGMVYLLALPGGWVADRLLGQQRAVWIGGLLIAAGNFILAIPGNSALFFAGLAVIVLGVGLLKPNISAIVGQLYQGKSGAQRDAGFSIFYMGINLGAFIAPLIAGTVGENWSWRAGFACCGLAMVVGLVCYRTLGGLGETGLYPQARSPVQRRTDWTLLLLGLVLIALMALLLLSGVVVLNPLSMARGMGVFIVALAVLFFAGVLLFGGLSADEKKRVAVIAVFFVSAAIFWSGFEQAGSTLNLFAERYTDRQILGRDMPTSWLQSVNPLMIIVLAPVFGWLWVALARRNLEPSIPAKFALGLLQLAAGFAVMVFAAKLVVSGGEGTRVLPTWLLLTYLLHTCGELCLSPIGLSAVTRLSPPRYVGQMMGTWFMGAALGNLVGGLIAGYFGQDDVAIMPQRYAMIVASTAGAGVLLMLLIRPIRKLIGNEG